MNVDSSHDGFWVKNAFVKTERGKLPRRHMIEFNFLIPQSSRKLKTSRISFSRNQTYSVP